MRAVIGFLVGLVLFLVLDPRRGSRISNSRLDTSNVEVNRAQVLQAERSRKGRCMRKGHAHLLRLESQNLESQNLSLLCDPISPASYACMQEVIQRFHHAKAYVKRMRSIGKNELFTVRQI